jgi:hypothetical protein
VDRKFTWNAESVFKSERLGKGSEADHPGYFESKTYQGRLAEGILFCWKLSGGT